jgi:hypothetical protein
LVAALAEALRDGDRLLAFIALVLGLAFLALTLGPAFLALVLTLAFLTLAFLTLVRVLMAVLAERRRDGFSVVVVAADSARVRPSPICLASCERCSE